MSHTVILLVVTPLMTAFLLSMTAIPHKVAYTTLKRIRMLLSVSGFAGLCVLLGTAGPGVLSGEVLTYQLGGWSPFLGIALRLDALSFLMATVAVLVSFLTMFYSFSYMERMRGLGKYDTFYFLMMTGMMGVLLTRDFFNMYVFLEILGLSVYILISSGEKKENYKASLKYLVLGSLASALFLLAVGILYQVTGSLNMDYAAQGIQGIVERNPSVAALVFALFVVSLGLKSGVVPLHFWLPDAHSMAPSPVSALLSGIVLKITVYCMIRVVPFFGPQFYQGVSPVIASVGAATVLGGTLLALSQKNIKRMLAYSSVSQIGIIIIGIGIGTDIALKGALFHIVNHALMKSGLFLCAGIMIHQSGTRDIPRLRMGTPGIAASFVVFSLGVVGIPPLNGFVSKFIICYGAVKAQYDGLAFVILIASLISCSYYFRVVQTFFSRKQGEKKEKRRKKKRERKENDPETPLQLSNWMRIPVYILAVLCLLLGLFPSVGLKAVELAVTVGGG